MMTLWHTEDYAVPARWGRSKIRSRVVNASGKVMVNDLDRAVAAAIVAEHNEVITALHTLQKKHPGDGPPVSL